MLGPRISFVLHRSFREPASSRPTILVQLEWDDESSMSTWPTPIRQIQSGMELIKVKRKIHLMNVGFIAGHLVREVHVGPVVDDTELERCWNGQLLHGITQILEKSPANRRFVNAVILCQIGTHWSAEGNPVTVYIAVGYGSEETAWPSVVSRLRQYLPQHAPRNIKVWMKHNN